MSVNFLDFFPPHVCTKNMQHTPHRPPLPQLCAAEGCSNIKRYADSVTNLPLCSLECYKKLRTTSRIHHPLSAQLIHLVHFIPKSSLTLCSRRLSPRLCFSRSLQNYLSCFLYFSKRQKFHLEANSHLPCIQRILDQEGRKEERRGPLQYTATREMRSGRRRL